MDEKRFERIYKQSTNFGGEVQILVDRETGVQYLFRVDGYGGGMTVLVGPDGNPLLYRGGL
ncbi:hypothetical protein H8711_04430 [Clostridiaceae bacterium NSJ-31]|uniref:DUF6440 domain-containing protein n=1 Tax=Ligaoa zhengdingensis TaxID=2763658 RepID=A0A926HZQ6_9FIRM|nr:DUF6440 family protein [Ligaoa zhengdingensis]MBC8546182.1 hypothetical protein [Ligaoa zhengdingensis]